MAYRAQRENLGRYKKDDIVRHYRTNQILRISGFRFRSELLNLVDLRTGENCIYHPRFLDLVEDPLTILAAAATE